PGKSEGGASRAAAAGRGGRARAAGAEPALAAGELAADAEVASEEASADDGRTTAWALGGLGALGLALGGGFLWYRRRLP
ncbi:MAG: hypothetical protein ACR2G3_05755, partial [Solirubrobacterales bacterium]